MNFVNFAPSRDSRPRRSQRRSDDRIALRGTFANIRRAQSRFLQAGARALWRGRLRRMNVTRSILPALFLLAACGGSGGAGGNEEAAATEAAGPDAPASEAELAADAALANEAAADEAADIENYGGSAAAMEANAQGNGQSNAQPNGQ
jgi:hypothetical protein